ncbi:MAG: MFS transporter [Anaerolineales bacterium]|nr:MFS transporter [Anaerolineales bacterium]
MTSDLLLISLSLFAWGLGEGMFFLFQPIYLQQLGASTMTIAGVLSAFGLAMMIVHIPAGYLSDRFGRRPLLWAAWSFGLLATWVMALARSLPFFVIGMLLYGLTAFVSAPLQSYVTAARGKLSPGRAMTLTSAAFNLGAVIGPLSGGWIGDRFGLRSVYFVAAFIFLISLGVILFLRAQPRDGHDRDSPPANLFSNRRFFGFLTVAFIAMFVMYLPQPFTPKFLENVRGLSLGEIGMVGSVGSLGNALLNLTLGHFNAWLGFLLAQASVGMFALLIWRGDSTLWYAAAYFLLGGFRAARMLIFAQVRPLIHQAQMGLAYGITEAFNSMTAILAPLLAGYLYTHDPALVYPVSIGLILAAIFVSLIFTPRGTVISKQ